MLDHAVKEFENKHGIDLLNSTTLLAVSGGIDSMVLAHLFVKSGYPVAIAHVNFGLRGADSDADEALVQQFAHKHNLPFHLHHSDTETYAKAQQLSIQMAAREIRHRFFQDLCKAHGYANTATAHHAGDNLENFFIYLLRNRTATALQGIAPVNEHLIRPLLAYSRQEISDYAKQEGIQWREDSSNEKIYYLRNKIRHMILPGLREFYPEVEQDFLEISEYWRRHKASSDARNAEYFAAHSLANSKNICIPNAPFSGLAGQRSLTWFLSQKGFNGSQIQDIKQATPGSIFSNGKFTLWAEASQWVLEETQHSPEAYSITLDMDEVGQTLHAGKFEIHTNFTRDIPKTFGPNEWYFAADAIEFPLVFRNWYPGDRLQPMGMAGHRKLSDLFTDAKIGSHSRLDYPVLQSGNVVLGVLGLRRSGGALVGENHNLVLKITW